MINITSRDCYAEIDSVYVFELERLVQFIPEERTDLSLQLYLGMAKLVVCSHDIDALTYVSGVPHEKIVHGAKKLSEARLVHAPSLCHNSCMLATTQQVEAFIKLFHQGNRLTYQKGEYIIRAGEVLSSVFYIEEGLVKAFNISKYGEENLLIIRRNHEIFPLIWALTGQEREVIYQALDTVIVWRIGREEFLTFLHEHSELLPPLLDMVTEMYRIHSERLLNLEYRTVRERLISFLLTMSNRFGKVTPEGLLVDVPLRHQDIASSINASRETTSRELAILERKGLISNSQLYFMIKDVESLKALL